MSIRSTGETSRRHSLGEINSSQQRKRHFSLSSSKISLTLPRTISNQEFQGYTLTTPSLDFSQEEKDFIESMGDYLPIDSPIENALVKASSVLQKEIEANVHLENIAQLSMGHTHYTLSEEFLKKFYPKESSGLLEPAQITPEIAKYFLQLKTPEERLSFTRELEASFTPPLPEVFRKELALFNALLNTYQGRQDPEEITQLIQPIVEHLENTLIKKKDLVDFFKISSEEREKVLWDIAKEANDKLFSPSCCNQPIYKLMEKLITRTNEGIDKMKPYVAQHLEQGIPLIKQEKRAFLSLFRQIREADFDEDYEPRYPFFIQERLTYFLNMFGADYRKAFLLPFSDVELLIKTLNKIAYEPIKFTSFCENLHQKDRPATKSLSSFFDHAPAFFAPDRKRFSTYIQNKIEESKTRQIPLQFGVHHSLELILKDEITNSLHMCSTLFYVDPTKHPILSCITLDSAFEEKYVAESTQKFVDFFKENDIDGRWNAPIFLNIQEDNYACRSYALLFLYYVGTKRGYEHFEYLHQRHLAGETIGPEDMPIDFLKISQLSLDLEKLQNMNVTLLEKKETLKQDSDIENCQKEILALQEKIKMVSVHLKYKNGKNETLEQRRQGKGGMSKFFDKKTRERVEKWKPGAKNVSEKIAKLAHRGKKIAQAQLDYTQAYSKILELKDGAHHQENILASVRYQQTKKRLEDIFTAEKEKMARASHWI